jgi:hypothetical protein
MIAMTSVAILTAVAALGVHWGWQPVAGGGIEYIIRIDPFLVDSMKDGHDVFSDLPATLPAIRSYRVTVSEQPVPHEGEPPPRSQSVSAARPPSDATSQPTLASDEPNTPATGSRLFPPPKPTTPVAPLSASSGSMSQHFARQPAASSAPAKSAEQGAQRVDRSPAPVQSSAAVRTSTPATASQPAQTNAPTPTNSQASEPAKSWPALAGALIVMFASLAANAWLVWIALEFRAKYLAQVAKLKPTG